MEMQLRAKLMRALLARTCGLVALMVPYVAHAQSSPSPTSMDGGATASGELEDIVVTARKKVENLRDVPVAVSAVPGTELVEKNIARLTDLVTVAPAFTLSLAANQPLTFIRGFGSAGNSSFEQSVGKFIDNVSFGRDFHARIPVYDMERIEVLKGPQVLLFGNSATAGAINMVTRKPGQDLAADLSTSYEFVNDEVLMQGGVTAPFGAGASLRVAGFFQDLSRGWIYNAGNGRHEPTFRNWGIRPTLRLTPAEQLTITLKAEVDRVRDKGSTGQTITQALPAFPLRQLPDVTLDRSRNANYDLAPFFTKEFAALNTEIYQGDVDYDLGGATLSSTTAYTVNHQGSAISNGTNARTLITSYDQRVKQFSQELRLSGHTGAITYIAGGYFQREQYHFYGFQLIDVTPYGIPIAPFMRFSTTDQTSKNYSIFGDLTWTVTPELSVSAGARYSIIRKTTDQSANPANFLGGLVFGTPRSAGTTRVNHALDPTYRALLGGIPHSFFDIRTREEHFQPQVTVQYRPSDRAMLYAKYVKGDKAGGVDILYNGSIAKGANTTDAQFRPERATSFEAGIKGRTASNRVEYGLTAYNTTFRDLQTGTFIGTAVFTTNVGEARTRGVEFDLAWALTPSLRLNGTAGYQDAKYLDYPGATCTTAQSAAGTCAPATGGQNLSGHRTPLNSKFLATLGLDYRGTIGSVTVNPGVSMVYRSKYNTSLNDDPLGDQHGFASLDAHIDADFAGGRATASLFARNLTDIAYKEYSVATPLVPGSFLTFIGRARQIGIRLSMRY